MIQVQTLLKVADNSGGKVVRCLKILKKGTKPRYGKIGDVIVVSVQKIRAKNKLTSKVKKGDVLSEENLRIIRPGKGLSPQYFDIVIGHSVNQDLKKGTALLWEHIKK